MPNHIHSHPSITKSRAEDCESGEACGQIYSLRNRYFTYKPMMARDFQDEQRFFQSRRHLHNRLLHGWGVVCGLQVERHPNPDCSDWVVVRPGIALDCCGREIILNEKTALRVWQPPDTTAGGASRQQAQTASPLPTQKVLVYIQYCEKPTEFTPVLYAEDACSSETQRMEANRIYETACLDTLVWDADNSREYAGCWPGTSDVNLTPCWKGCDEEMGEPQEGCLDPACPCALGVPLALISLVPGGEGYRVDPAEEAINTKGRPSLESPGDYKTHIVRTNWIHGGDMSASDLLDPNGANGRLMIYFDRPLKEISTWTDGKPNNGSGVNEMTFQVRVHRQDDARYPVEYLYTDGNLPVWDKQNCAAVFYIERLLLERQRTLVGSTLHITLKCDFIPDCNGNPVSGRFTGEFPTQGPGTFESWFRVVEDIQDWPARYREYQKEQK